jgi:acyl-coenzyme A thioesterase PaaI-like protein
VDFNALAEALRDTVPFNQHLGLEVSEIAPGRAVVRLPEDERLRNHVGSQHAGALFAAGEAASGGALLGAFGERLSQITPLAESAEIVYRRIARGPIEATARLGDAPEQLLGKLDEDGVVRFPVDVELTDPEGKLVAEMVVRWHVRRNPLHGDAEPQA